METKYRCCRCKEYFPEDEVIRTVRAGSRNNEDKYRCKPCRRAVHLKNAYGITVEEFTAQLNAQNGMCACCGKVLLIVVEKHLTADHAVVDHDHVTGRLRGIICSSCNTGIGRLGDNAEGVATAYRYLTQFTWHTEWIQDELNLFPEAVT